MDPAPAGDGGRRRPDRAEPGGGWLARGALAVLARPSLWSTAVIQLLRLAPRRWWRRPPFLPLPDAAYLRFRLQTQYGDPERAPEPADLLSYLRWCRRYGRLNG